MKITTAAAVGVVLLNLESQGQRKGKVTHI